MCSDALIGAKIKATFDNEHGLYGAKREVSQVLFRLSRWENLEYAKKI